MRNFGVRLNFRRVRLFVYAMIFSLVTVAVTLCIQTYLVVRNFQETYSRLELFIGFFSLAFQQGSSVYIMHKYHLWLMSLRMRFQQINALME